jgi:multiple sugar transport system ATP-binding protein
LAGLSLRSVSKRFGNIEAVRDVTVEIDAGEFAVFVGPSGCGKSTLLRLIAGLEEPTTGEIHLDGDRIDVLPPGARGVAMVFQHFALYPHMTVYENMAFGLRNIGVGVGPIDQKITSIAQILEIAHLLERRPRQLSAGQRQRVAIGRAMVKQPKVFLFDEPLSNLDAALRARTRIELARMHQRMQATMIFVTHDQVEAMTMASRIAVMNQGRIEQVGTPMEVYRQPRSRFVAAFIGTPGMNFLPVAAADVQGSRMKVRLTDGATIDSTIPAAAVRGIGPLTLGVRAENVHAGGGTAARVDVIERLGDRTLIYAVLGDGSTIVYDEPGDAGVRIGEKVELSFDGTAVHLFDATGRAYHAE